MSKIPPSSGAGSAPAIGPTADDLSALGKLSFLASFCPMHASVPARHLARLFFPAINNNCVRFFENEDNVTCAALIWARLSDEVSERMIYDKKPPNEEEWASGHNVWFLDLIAPFDHGRWVARHLARNPPDGPFYFARLGSIGEVKKVVQGDATRRGRNRIATFHLNHKVA